MTDQPRPDDPNAAGEPTLPELAAPDVPAPDSPAADAGAAAPPPPPAVPWTTPAQAPAAKPPSKLRAIIPVVVIAGILGVVLFMTRDNQKVDDLAIGQCFDVPTNAEISTVTKHPCTEAHDAEVFHVTEYSGGSGSYPITLTLESFIDGACTPVFESYVGISYADSTTFDYGYFYPTLDGWNDGDRTITCYIKRADKTKLTTTVKGAAS